MKVAPRPTPIILSCALLLVGFVPATDPELPRAEKLLRDHAIGTDGPSVLAYFALRTLTPENRGRLAQQVRDLGNENFAVRQQASAQLIRTGPPALPLLRAALNDPDLERVLRAERCIEAIEAETNEPLLQAAVRVLVARRPPGAVAALLAFLPDCPDEATVWTIRQGLLALTQHDGKVDPVLIAALADGEPARRGAAAYSLGRAASAELRRLRPLLQDPDPFVRFEAAHALARGGDRNAVPVLIALLADTPIALSWQVHELLLNLPEDTPPAVALPDDQVARRTIRKAWLDWWQVKSERVDLAGLRVDVMRQQGVNILLENKNPYGSNIPSKVWECRADGKERWTLVNCTDLVDVHVLPGGRLLVAAGTARMVTERDRTGKVVWAYTADGFPTTCQRLPNGNTFIATSAALFEVDPNGKTVTSFANSSRTRIFRARRLSNGNTLFLSLGGKIVELDRTGAEIRTIDLGLSEDRWGGVEPLPGGRFLVWMFSQNRVFEVDADGHRSHEITVPEPTSAVHLPNGHTLIASYRGSRALECDGAGRVVWQQRTTGWLFCVRRY